MPNWCRLTNGWEFLRINCCAGTAITQHRVTIFYPEPKGDKTFTVVRNPFNRLYNNWLDPQFQAWFPTIDKLVDHVCAWKELEHHIRPQSDSMTIMPNVLFNFDHIDESMMEMGLKLRKNPHTEYQGKDHFTPEQQERLRGKYSKDFELWEDLLMSGRVLSVDRRTGKPYLKVLKDSTATRACNQGDSGKTLKPRSLSAPMIGT